MSENFMSDAEYIYEPVEQYQSLYKERHHQNVVDYFKSLVEKSKVDVPANQETNKQIKKFEVESSAVAKRIGKYSALKGFLIFLVVAFIATAVFGVGFMIYQGAFLVLHFLLALFGIIFSVLLIVLIVVKIKPIIAGLRSEKSKVDDKIREQSEIAWEQMKPLNSLFTYGMSTALFHKTIPLINLDAMFDSRRLDYLVGKFHLDGGDDRNRSTLFVQSGDINGNPFYLCNDLVHHMGTKTYTGTLTISWTSTTYINGRAVTTTHTQTLRANVDKPYPYYNEIPYLVYGNEAAPDLSFNRNDSDAENLTQKEIDRQVNKEIKKLEKKSEKSTMAGQDYTVMGNSEFEVLFGAHDRDNEVQFRLLFTPLAQKQLLALMKDKTIGYGDDFDFRKRKMINYVYPSHLQQIKLDVSPSYFHGRDIDAIEKAFIDYNDAFFRGVYFAFAPVLSIPLYQQQKPREYIYKDLYDSYISFYEHENVANRMNVEEFKHPLCQTRNILKTSVVKSGDFCDTVKVTAYGFRTENRVDYVNVLGGDGRVHSVAVPWVEYLPVEQDSFVDIALVQEKKEESAADKVKALVEKLQKRELSGEELYRFGAIVAIANKKLKM